VESDLPRQEKVCGSLKKVYCKIRSINTTVKVEIYVIPVWYEVGFCFEILAEPILSSLKVYGKKVGLILNIKVNHGLDKFGLRVVIHCYRPPRQYSIGLENTEMLLV
jgi:hypothetical protein